jgi:hypothetical protein
MLNWYRTPLPTIGWTTGTMRDDAQVRLQTLTMSATLAVFFSFLKRIAQITPIVNLNTINTINTINTTNTTSTGNGPGTLNATVPSDPGFTGSPPEGNDGDKTDRAEWDWVAIDELGFECHPGKFDILHRSDDHDDLNKLFAEGLPVLPGTDFRIENHQRRIGGRVGTGDPFYGATVHALWGDNEGPLGESGGRYMLVLRNVYGVVVQGRVQKDPMDQYRAEIIEMEIIFRTVPGHKVLAVLDKMTGEVHANPNLSTKVTAPTVERLRQLYKAGVIRGDPADQVTVRRGGGQSALPSASALRAGRR